MNKLALAFVFTLLFLGVAFSSQQTAQPVNVQYSHYYLASAPYLFFNTALFGYPILKLVYDPTKVILSPPGANWNDLPNNAILCPGALNATLDTNAVVWAHSSFNGSSQFAGPSTRPFPNPLGGGNPITTNIPIISNSSLGTELEGLFNSYVRRADVNNIWNRTDAITTTPQNVRYFRTVPSPPYNCVYSNQFGDCIPSSESKTSVVCRGKVIINGTEYGLSSSQTQVSLASNPLPGSTLTATGSVRLDKCTGVIHSLFDNDPAGSSPQDKMFLFRVPAISTFPSSSGNASLSVRFENPSCFISIAGGLFGPFNLTTGQYVILNLSVTNSISTILSANITGVSQHPSNPPNSMAVTLIPSPNNVIPPGQMRTIQVNLTQGNPPFNGTLSFILSGSTIGNGCAGSPLSCNATFANVVILNGSVGGNPPNITEYCSLAPNPISLAATPVQVNATCFRIVNNGAPTQIQCPTLNWSTSAPNTTISPPITARSMMPFSSLSRSGNTTGGLLRVTNGTISCNATILPFNSTPGTVFEYCQLVPNPISLATSPMRINATCFRIVNNTPPVPIICPTLNWSTSAPNTSISPPITTPSFAPFSSLSRFGNTTGGLLRVTNGSIACNATILPVVIGGPATQYCTLSPNPISLATTPVRVNATCYQNTSGMITQISCPSLAWSTTAPNTTVLPTNTLPGLSPYSNLSRFGNTSGGIMQAANGSLACNATILPYNTGGGGNLSNYSICIVLPNPVALGVDPALAYARCFDIVNGIPFTANCPNFTWTKTNQNLTLNPAQTPSGFSPNVSVHYAGIVPGGQITASNGPLSCNTSVSCGPLFCVLSSSPSNNRITPPQTLNLSARCTNQTSPNAKCYGLDWFQNMTNVSLEFNHTNASFSPANRLFTNSNTPAQSGRVWAMSSDYCSLYSCDFPVSPDENVTISNQSCSYTCNMSSPLSGSPLGYGPMAWFADCYSAITGQQVGCPASWWRSDAGVFNPNQTANSSGQITSELNVTIITGTYVRINFTDPFGYACSCNATLLSALPDYVPLISRVVPSGPIMLGNSVQIYHKTKNQGNADAVNDTTTQIELPGGQTYGMNITPPLPASVTSPESPHYTYTCLTEGLKTYSITADSFYEQDESNENNNQLNSTINCGNVLVCADYI